jgi:hypothetical protein
MTSLPREAIRWASFSFEDSIEVTLLLYSLRAVQLSE